VANSRTGSSICLAGQGQGKARRPGRGQGGQGRGQIKSKKDEKIKLIKQGGRRSRAPTRDFTVAFGHGHPLVHGI